MRSWVTGEDGTLTLVKQDPRLNVYCFKDENTYTIEIRTPACPPLEDCDVSSSPSRKQDLDDPNLENIENGIGFSTGFILGEALTKYGKHIVIKKILSDKRCTCNPPRSYPFSYPFSYVLSLILSIIPHSLSLFNRTELIRPYIGIGDYIVSINERVVLNESFEDVTVAVCQLIDQRATRRFKFLNAKESLALYERKLLMTGTINRDLLGFNCSFEYLLDEKSFRSSQVDDPSLLLSPPIPPVPPIPPSSYTAYTSYNPL